MTNQAGRHAGRKEDSGGVAGGGRRVDLLGPVCLLVQRDGLRQYRVQVHVDAELQVRHEELLLL